jgi:hypothetical protein
MVVFYPGQYVYRAQCTATDILNFQVIAAFLLGEALVPKRRKTVFPITSAPFLMICTRIIALDSKNEITDLFITQTVRPEEINRIFAQLSIPVAPLYMVLNISVTRRVGQVRDTALAQCGIVPANITNLLGRG